MFYVYRIRNKINNKFYGKKHSEETERKISESRKGTLPSNTRKVIIDGDEYESATDTSRKLGVVVGTIVHRIKSKNPKYGGYFYKDEL